MKTKNNIFSVMLSGAKYLWHGAAPARGRRSFTMFRMTMMLAAAMALAACTNDESLAPAPADALAAMNPETRIGISAELGGELTASRNTTTETEAVYAMDELHGTKSGVAFTLNLPGGVKTQLYPTDENGHRTAIAFNALAENLPLYLKDFKLTEGDGRRVSRWTILGANYNSWDNSLGWARLAADETGKPKLNYTLQRGDAKVTLKVVDAEVNAIDMRDITAKFNMTNTLVTPIYTGAGDPTNGYPALKDYLGTITTLAADDAVDANKIKLAVYAFGNPVTDYFLSLVDAAGAALADDHAYSRMKGYMSAIVLATPTYTENDDGTYTPIANPAFAKTDAITITVEDNYFDDKSNQVGGTYKLMFADIAAGDDVPAEQKTAEDKLKYLAPGDHLTVTVTLSHNSVASATATLGSWTEVGAEGGTATGGDAEAFGKGNIAVTAEMTPDAVQAAVAESLAAGDTYLYITGNLTGGQLVAVGSAIKAFEESATGENAGTVSLTMPNQTTIPADATVNSTGAFEKCYALKSVSMPALTAIEGDETFKDCHALKSVSMPVLSKIIGEYAFNVCTALTEITLKNGASIGIGAFTGCKSLATVNGTLSETIGFGAFGGCSALTAITLANVTSIGDGAFAECTGMTSLTLQSVVTEVGFNAFLSVGNGNCALTLASGQKEMEFDNATNAYNPTDKDVTASETPASWAGNTWKSITIANTNE